MANPAWYNDNQFRDYPFLTQVEPLQPTTGFSSSSSSASVDGEIASLPHSAIVDFGAIMEIDSEYSEEAGHYVYLHSIARVGDDFTFTFRTTALDGSEEQLVFARTLGGEFEIEWEDSSTISAGPAEPLACPIRSRWSGFLVTGDLTELGTVIAPGETVVYRQGLWQIEPARIQSLMDSYLRAINLANNPRTIAEAPEGCDSSSHAGGGAILHASCIAGNIKWKEGFNCTIRQDNGNNAIIIGAGAGVGEGQPCDEVPLYDGEQPQLGSPYLSGGPSCTEIIKSINGVTGANVTIVAGPGFRVQADQDDPHKLVINQSLDDFALCLADATSSSSLSAAALMAELLLDE